MPHCCPLCSPRNYYVSWEQTCPYTALNKRRNDFTLKSTQKSLKHKAIPGMDGTQIYLGTMDFFMFLFLPYTSSLGSLSFPSVAQSYRWEGILVIQGDHSGSGTWVSKLPTLPPKGPWVSFSELPALSLISGCLQQVLGGIQSNYHNSQEDTDDGCNSQDICNWKETT